MRLPGIVASLVVVAILALSAPAWAGKTTAAVMPLGKGAGPAQYDGLGRALADMMVTDLSNSSALQLVERMKLKLVLDELQLAKSGFLDKRTAQKLGRGLGAQLVITGSFSVIGKQFVMDIRIVQVKSGAILKAARSEGLLDDFIAIEKDVVEKLLAGLDVKLSAGARRKLLLAAPTESVTALASYGRGVEASEAGLQKQAKAAFEEALKEDPDFARASLALRDLATMAEAASKSEKSRYKAQVQAALDKALLTIPSELRRSRKFKDTRASLLDFTIRMHLLARADKHCTRYAELKHYFLRTEGEFEGWFVGLKPTYQESWRAGEDMMVARARQLGLVGRDTLFGSNGRGLMFEASPSFSSGPNLLLYRSLSPEKFDTIIGAMERCHTPAVQIAEFDALRRKISKWKWLDKSLSSTVGIGPATYTARDSIDLYWAYLRARHRGMDAKVRARSDAVLARHPVGDADRRNIISRIKGIVSAGESHERQVAARMKLNEKQLLRYAHAAQDNDKKLLHSEHPTCKSAMSMSSYSIERNLATHAKMSSRISADRRRSTMNRLASSIAILVRANCFRRGKRRPLSNKQVFALVDKGIKRPHPAKLKDSKCLERVQTLRKSLETARTAPHPQIAPLLRALHGLRTGRCLLP